MKKVILKIALIGLIVTTLFSCSGNKNEGNNTIETFDGRVDSITLNGTPQIPEIIEINKSPDRLTKEVNTYTVTLITDSEKVKLDDTEFSMDEKNWQKTGEFKDIKGGNYIFYARNKQDKSLLYETKQYLDSIIAGNDPPPTAAQLNNYIIKIADYDDKAIDSMRNCLGNACKVKGAENIRDVQQLITDISTKSAIYSVTDIETKSGIVTSISVSKK